LSFVRNIVDSLLDEVKAILRGYAKDTEVAVKKRLRRMIIYGVITGILSSLVISLVGSASLFFLIGNIEYLRTIMPIWDAFDVAGFESAVGAVVVFVLLLLILRKELKG
jgi:uncharacterized MnhB-related membrane protein